MTNRRWQQVADEFDFGPVETKVRAELTELGWQPGDGVGPLQTLAAQAVSMAEILDRTMNAAATPGLNRELRSTMAEARLAAEGLEIDEVEGILNDDGGTGRRTGTSGPHHTVTHLRPVP